MNPDSLYSISIKNGKGIVCPTERFSEEIERIRCSDMSEREKEIALLNMSIEKYEWLIAKMEDEWIPLKAWGNSCSLCAVFYAGGHCGNCPLRKHVCEENCHGTGWSNYYMAADGGNLRDAIYYANSVLDDLIFALAMTEIEAQVSNLGKEAK